MSINLKKCVPYVRWVALNLPAWAAQYGVWAEITSAYRSPAQQKKLYALYKQGLMPYPVARPGTSAHEKGLALDIATNNRAIINKIMTYLGFSWGGFRDPVHYELRLN